MRLTDHHQTDKITYTVQLMATRNSVSINSFKTPEEVREIIFGDGIYRYITGEYDSKNDALTALRRCHESGYKDAFIREMNLITNR
jgi:hypothetical protein